MPDSTSLINDPNFHYCRRCWGEDTNTPHGRYYCPQCGEVTCGMRRQNEWLALPHYRKSIGPRSDGPSPPNEGQRVATGPPCRGGPIDPKKDRAP